MPASEGRVKTQTILSNGSTDVVVDSDGALLGIDRAHQEIHDGNAFGVSHVFSGVADAANSDVRFSTSTRQPHVLFQVAASGKAQMALYQGAVLGTGTAVTVNNRDLSKAEATGVTFGHSPTVTSVGALLFSEILPGGSKNSAVGGSASARDEWMLKASTVYLIRVTNRSGAASEISVGASGYV